MNAEGARRLKITLNERLLPLDKKVAVVVVFNKHARETRAIMEEFFDHTIGGGLGYTDHGERIREP